MNPETTQNIGHSIFQKLLNHARTTSEDFNLLLARYGVERVLYRLSRSEYSEKFVLKGASLFLIWMGKSYRVTRDADFLGSGPADPALLAGVFSDVINVSTSVNDGLIFDPNSIKAVPIREDQVYDGVRVTFTGLLHTARIPVQIDIGFGDSVVPAPEQVEYPSILGQPAAQLRAYTRYTMVAEKTDAMIRLGMINSRMKDFYDIWLMSGIFDFDGTILHDSMKSTFVRRGTGLPGGYPIVFTEEFISDKQKQIQWKAFLHRSHPEKAPEDFSKVMEVMHKFVVPVYQAIQQEISFRKKWVDGGPWV